MGELDLEKGSVTKGNEEYLIDDNIKKLQRVQSPSPPTIPPPEPRRAPAPKAVQVLTKERKKQKPTEFREDARIWQLYLEEAEEKAKDKAELWNTGLDSLLIFAGLFAGVVSSFVIDARRDLQSDSEPRLLTGILDVLRNGSIGDIFAIPSSAYWVSGLWIVSLFTTIFSAIMGVLAKAWLAKYVPATTRREAKDAYLRYKLDRQSERWHLKEVLILVPLLVQIASVLFLAGLIVQLYGDSVTLGQALLCFCILGGLIYVSMTVFPLLVPSSPFNTPLSEMFEALFGQDPEVEDRSAYKTDIDEGLGEILYTKLIQSPKPTHVDEAIAEVALSTFMPKWTKFLCRNETPRILLTRFRHCATFRTNDTMQREETLCNHLLALLSFAEHYEDQLQTSKEGKDVQSYKTLDKVLRESLEPGNPLHRWNELPEALRPLLFALRTNVLVLLRSSPSITEHETPSDFNANELTDRPWEMSFQEIRSTHRIHYTVAACRGLVAGERHLKTISSFILCLSLAKAAFTASETGRTSEWASSLKNEERDDVNALAMRYLSKLYQATVDAWERMAADALKDLLSVEVPLGETETARSNAGVLRSLIFSLSQQNHALRIHAIRMLKHVSSPTNPVLFSGLITESVKSIASMAVYDDQDVREDGLDLLTELSKADDAMSHAIRTALVNSVHSGFSKYEDQPRVATVQFIEKVSAQGSQSQFVSVINDVIPRLTEIALDESSSERVRGVAMKLLQRLWNGGFIDVKHSILRYLDKLLDSSEFSSRYNFLNALQQLAKAKDFPQGNERPPSTFPWLTPSEFVQDTVTDMFGRLVKVAIYDEDSTIYTAAQDILALVARDDRFYNSLPLEHEVLDWLEAATVHPSRWRARLNAVLVVQMFIKRFPVTEELLEKVLKLALRDDDDDVRAASLKLASAFLQDDHVMETFAGRVKDTIVSDSPENIISFESYTYITDRWVPFLIKIAKSVSFPESTPYLVQRAMAADDGSDTKTAIMGYLASEHFAEDSASHEALRKAIPTDLLAHVVLPNLEDVLTKRRWVKLLADLLPIECLNQLATDALFPVKDSVKATLNGSAVNAAEKDDADTTTEESEDVSYLAESTVSASLRRLIYKAGWYERMHWAAILATLSAIYPEEFPEAPKIVLAVAVHDYDSDVRHGTLQSLRSLVNADATRQGLLEGVMENMDRLAQDSDWNVRFALAQVLAAFVKSNECELPKECTDKLATMAIDDRDYDVRSESVNSLAVIVENEGRYPEASRIALEKFDAGIKDGHWKPRQSWVNFISPQLKYAESPHVTRVFDVAIGDDDPDVRNTALEVLDHLLKDKDSKLRDSMASQLGKSVAAALKNTELRGPAMSALTKLTLPASKATDGQPPDEKPAGHETWTQIIVLLGRNEFQGVPKLIELAFKEDSADSFSQVVTMFQKVNLQDPIQSVLPRFLESALKLDANTTNDVRTGAVKLMSRLAGVERDEPYYGDLLGETNDAQIVSRLADIAVKDVDDELRKSALKLLKSMFSDTSRFPDFVKSSLSKAVESCFRDPELMKYRYNAIAVLNSLTEQNTNNDYERFKDIVSPSISHLLKMTLLVTDKEHEYMRKQAEDILLENLTAYPTETKLNRDVLSAIPAMIPTITVEGRRIVLQLAETLQLSDETAASIAHALAPLLRTTSSFARATAIELLSRLYSAHRTSNPRLIESAIPEIITLALDEKDDVGEIRTTAIQLLVAISAAPKATNDENSTTASSMNSPVVKQITPLATKFMGLLLNENLRASVVELLSLMATEATVRRTITLQIMSLAFGTDNVSLQGHTELLARLISDGRFGDEPTDKVMLFVASAMVTRPKLAPYRFEILTALWCRYASKSIAPTPQDAADKVVKPNDLVDWFTFALFGRHATVPEVRTWLKRCKVWLPDEPEPEPEHHHIEHDGESAVKEETVKSSKQSSVAPEPEHEEVVSAQRSVHSSLVESSHEEHIDHPEEPAVNEGSASSKRSSTVLVPKPELGEHSENASAGGPTSLLSDQSPIASNNPVPDEEVEGHHDRDRSPSPEPPSSSLAPNPESQEDTGEAEVAVKEGSSSRGSSAVYPLETS